MPRGVYPRKPKVVPHHERLPEFDRELRQTKRYNNRLFVGVYRLAEILEIRTLKRINDEKD
jgi:hypothetical protein